MPIPLEHMKERLSIAYVSAVAAKAGVACRPTTAPEYGTDAYLVRINHVNGKYVETGWILNCQVKSTSNWEIQSTQIAYDMDVDDFNKLAEWDGATPCILILFCVPDGLDKWLTVDEDELIVKQCCYWTKISEPPTTNKSKKRVFVPRSQLLTPDTINDLLERVRQGQL